MYNKFLSLVFYVIISFVIMVGILSIYRGLLSNSSLSVISGKVLNKARDYTSGRGRAYYTAFKLEGLQDEIAINFPSESAANNDSAFYLVDTGKVYKFYVNPTYPTINGINKGLVRIDYNNIEIYKASNIFNLFMGIFMCVLGLGGIFMKIKYKKKESEN